MRIPAHLRNVHVSREELARTAALLNAAGRTREDGKPFRADDTATAVFARQVEYVRAKTTDVLYAESKALQFIPLATDVPAGAQSFVTQQWDMAGTAKIISNFADDLPRVSVLGKERSQIVQRVGNSYDYSMVELEQANYAGVPLNQKKANAARAIHERTIDELAAFGDAEAGLPGFANNSNVGLTTVTNGDWDNVATTSAQILADLHEIEWAIVTTSKELFEPDTMIFAPSLYEIIATKPYSTTIPDTILSIFLRNSKFVKNVYQWHKLENADAEGDGPRAICYKRTPEVVELVLPKPFTQEPPQWRNLSAVINCHSAIGGVQVNYPLGITYVDALLDT